MRNFPPKIVLLVAVILAIDVLSGVGWDELLLQSGIAAVLAMRSRS